MSKENGEDMKKLKSIGFGLLYTAIPICVQLLISLELMMAIVIMRMFYQMEVSSEAVEKMNSASYNMILVTLVNLILIAGMGSWYYFIRKRRQDERQVPRKKIVSPASIGTLFGMAVWAQFACNLIILLFAALFPGVYENYAELAETLDISVLPAGVIVLIVGIWAPLAEEIAFRAMVFRTLRKGFSFWPAAIFSGIMFGIYHMNWVQGVYATFLGVLLAYIYEKTDSVWGSYLFHLMFNCLSYLISWVGEASALPDTVLGVIMMGMTFLALGGLPLFIWLFSKMYRTVPREPVQQEPLQHSGEKLLEGNRMGDITKYDGDDLIL